MPSQHLTTSSLAECHPESPGGVKALGVYDFLARIAEEEISRAAAVFIEEPIERPGSVEWHTRQEGVPFPLESLTGTERDAALDSMCSMAASWQAMSERLLQGGADSRETAGLLAARVAQAAAAAAVGARGPRLYMVGGAPVLAAWGLSTSRGGLAEEGFDLTGSGSELAGQIFSGRRTRLPETPPEPVPAADPLAAAPQAWNPEEAGQEEGQWQAPPPVPPAWPPPGAPEGRTTRSIVLPAVAGSLLLLLMLPAVFWSLFARTRPVPALAPDEDIAIPEGTESFEFLAWCWLSGGGLVNTETWLPVLYRHCFDDAGNAVVTIDEKTAEREHKDTCVSTAAARVEGDSLYIATGPEGHRCRLNPEHSLRPRGSSADPACRGRPPA